MTACKAATGAQGVEVNAGRGNHLSGYMAHMRSDHWCVFAEGFGLELFHELAEPVQEE